MSHNTTYKNRITDIGLLCQKAEELGYSVETGEQIVRLYGQNSVQAVATIGITGWRYPIAITAGGDMIYDHFGSKSGTMEKLHDLVNQYNQELVMDSIPMDIVQNYYTEELENGETKLVLEY